jgi:hypothetical protein
MKKTLILFLSFLLFSCYEQERNCKEFKTGKFEFVTEIKGVKKTGTFERFKDYQIETFNGKTDTSSVRWVNDCEFITRKLHPKTMAEKEAVSIKILTTHDNTYTFEYSIVGKNQKQLGTVTKLK